jgi:outer membrane lipase/esterase
MAGIAAGLGVLAQAGARAEVPAGGAVWGFGDSLVDDGNIPHYYPGLNYPASPPYYAHHFSNGPVFVEYLPGLIGSGFAAANDFAVGGAFAGEGNLAGDLLPRLPGTAAEIAAAAAGGLRFTPRDTVVLWAGSNNYFAILGTLAPGTALGAPVVQADIAAVSGAIAQDAGRLIGLGARRLVVLNVPDLGSTPSYRGTGQQALATGIAEANNTALVPKLAALHAATGASIYLVNAELGIQQILGDPAKYGLTDTTHECLTTPACAGGGRAAQDRYLFWDDVHPTTAVHDILAGIVANQLTAGQTLGGEAELMIAQAGFFTDSLIGRLDGTGPAPPPGQAGPVSFFLQGTYGSGSRDQQGSSAGFSFDTGAVMAGAEYRPRPGLLLGAAFGYGQPHAEFDSGSGSITYDAYQGALYAGLSDGVLHADLVGAYSGFSSNGSHRPGVVGETILTDPSGHAWSVAGALGARYHAGALTWGPVAALTWAGAVVGAYTETGDALLVQQVDRQDVDSLRGRAGLEGRVAFDAGGWRLAPHGALSAEREFLDTARDIGTGFPSAGLPLSTRVGGYGGTYGRLDAGLDAALGGALGAALDLTDTFGRGNGEDRAVYLKLQASF